jgi:hypothetical protein
MKNNKVWYHTTKRKNLDSIKTHGLKINQVPNFSIGSILYMSHFYNDITPIFISKDPNLYKTDNEKLITLEIHKLSISDLAVDIPTIISKYKAEIPDDFEHLDEKFIFFREDDVPFGMQYIDDDNGEVYVTDMLRNTNITKDLINLSSTAAVMKNILPEQIRLCE